MRTAARIAVLAGLLAAGAWLASGRDALAATSCPAGPYLTSQGSCVQCPAGGQARCVPCPAGRFAARPGLQACEACPRGTISPAGAALCTAAPS